MADAVKFRFDTVFAEEGDDGVPAPPKKTRWTEREVEAERQAARAEGSAAAVANAETRAAESLAAAAGKIAAAADDLLGRFDEQQARLSAEAATLALTIARKLAPALIASRPLAEIEAVVRDCLTHLNREPHLVVRVADGQLDALKERIDAIAFERGLADKVVLLGDPGIGDGDCTIEWADGGIKRDTEALDREIADIVAHYVRATTGEAAGPNEPGADNDTDSKELEAD